MQHYGTCRYCQQTRAIDIASLCVPCSDAIAARLNDNGRRVVLSPFTRRALMGELPGKVVR